MPFGIFSTPNTSAQSYCPARIAPAASWSAAPPLAQPASTSTIGIPVRASAPSTLWPDATPPYAVPQNAAWNVGLAGFGQRGAHCVHAHVGVREVVEAPERMDADAGYFDANAHVTTPSCSSSATSVIGCPKASAAGSASVRRVTMRRRSSVSSTTPNP